MTATTHRDTTYGLGNDEENGSIKSLNQKVEDKEEDKKELNNGFKDTSISSLIMPQSLD